MRPDAKSVLDLAPYPSHDEWIEGLHPDWLPGEPEVAARRRSWSAWAVLVFAAFTVGLTMGSTAAALVLAVKP